MRRPLPPLKALPIFLAAAKTESFGKASELQHITLSAVSQQIKRLEEDLACTLFQRTHNGVQLTEPGRQFLQDIEPALAQLEQAKTRLNPVEKSHITISLLNSLATFWLIPQLPDLYAQYPDLDVRISTNWSLAAALQSDIDLIIGYGHATDWPNHHVEHLCSDRLIAVCHPDLIQDDSEPMEHILKRYKLLGIQDISFRQENWTAWCEAHQIKQPDSQHFMRFSSSAQAIQACLNQVGIFVTHEIFVHALIRSGQLRQLGQIITEPEHGYYLIFTHPQRYPTLKRFCKWCHESLHNETFTS